MLSHLRLDLWFFDLFDRIGNKERILNYGTWLTAKRVLNPGALTLARAWVVLFPLIAFLASLLPLEMHIDRISITIGESYVPPFNIALSIISAISLILADAVYKLFCPDVVQRYEPVFNKFPNSYPPDMADRDYRAYLFAGTQETDVIYIAEDRYDIQISKMQDGKYKVIKKTEFEPRPKLTPAWFDRACSLNASCLRPFSNMTFCNFLSASLFFEDKNGGVSNFGFRAIYEFSIKIRVLPRLIFWLFYMTGAVLGVCLTAQIMWRALVLAVSL